MPGWGCHTAASDDGYHQYTAKQYTAEPRKHHRGHAVSLLFRLDLSVVEVDIHICVVRTPAIVPLSRPVVIPQAVRGASPAGVVSMWRVREAPTAGSGAARGRVV